ncbi:MAG: ClpXP protease specificity-enhancing factor [Burkholderiaceae bacterium]|nr:ClpXP protease specificity-enhancing factor [Burkholderiaceae bacterium]
MGMSETSIKPYFIRAVHQWCSDLGYTPYLSVLVNKQTQIPLEYVRNGEIVLNVGLLATSKLQLDNEFVSFQARFNGIAREIFVPISQITAIYARETGQGMFFETAQAPEQDSQMEATRVPSSPVSSLNSSHDSTINAEPGLEEKPTLAPVKLEIAKNPENDNFPHTPAPARSKPTLTRVK